jgi:hypothetical protein
MPVTPVDPEAVAALRVEAEARIAEVREILASAGGCPACADEGHGGRQAAGFAFAGFSRDYARCTLGHVWAIPEEAWS